jgi:hypothetical protein
MSFAFQRVRKEMIILWGVILGFTFAITVFVLAREYMAFGTETDYLGGFVPEARRFLNGEALQLDFHPPLYSFLIGVVWLVLRDWFHTGLAVSVLSGAGLLAISYLFFRRVHGTFAGWGAIIGLLASPVFISYWALATSDLFFVFLYWPFLLALGTGVELCDAFGWRLVPSWVSTLTRMNGFTSLVLLLVPWFAWSAPRKTRALNFVAVCAGVAALFAMWLIYAMSTGSRVMPDKTAADIAFSYFSAPEDRYVGDVRMVFEKQFHSLWEVLAYDPATIAKSYLRDLLILARRLFHKDELLAFPVNHFVIPGLFFLLLVRPRLFLGFVVVAVLGQVLLVNIKAFEGRFYLFLLPIFGAAVGVLAETVLGLARRRIEKIGIAMILGILGAGAVLQAFISAYPYWHSQDTYLRSIVSEAKPVLRPGATVVALRPHIPFYLDAASVYFPHVTTMEELDAFLVAKAKSGPVYVFFGDEEVRLRKQLDMLGKDGVTKKWLRPVARASQPEAWILYEYRAVP